MLRPSWSTSAIRHPIRRRSVMPVTTTTNPVLEAAAREFAEATANPPYLFDLGPVEGRKTVDQVQAGEIDKPDVDIEDTTLPGGPAGEVSVRILRPQGATGALPVFIYIHGAGWVFGNSHTHDRLIRELAAGTGAAVVFPNYSLSPEARYPTALEESFAVVRWVAEHGGEKDLDGSRVAVAGDSVGGNMSAALTLLAKERGGPALGAQGVFYPGPNAALAIAAEADVRRDEREAYANRLREAGVPVTAMRYQGIIHDFVMLNALRGTQAATSAIAQAIGYLRAALGTRA